MNESQSGGRLRIAFNAPVTLTFVILALVALIAGTVTGGASTKLLFTTYRSSLKSPLTYVRFFTHVLGHSGWDHYFGNMTYILLLGPLLEEKYGSWRLLAIMALTALVTGLVNFLLFPSVALCGASGIVFAFILLSSFTGFAEGGIPLTAILVAVVFLGQQVVDGVFVRDNISQLSHIIGGVIGAVIGYALNKNRLS